MSFSNRISSLVAFLRFRYPAIAPPVGYAPVLALLPRRMSDEEISVIATRLRMVGRRAMGRVDVGVEITRGPPANSRYPMTSTGLAADSFRSSDTRVM